MGGWGDGKVQKYWIKEKKIVDEKKNVEGYYRFMLSNFSYWNKELLNIGYGKDYRRFKFNLDKGKIEWSSEKVKF